MAAFRLEHSLATPCIALALLLMLAVGAPRIAQEAAGAEQEARSIPNAKCFGCHDDEEITNDAGESLAVPEAQYGVSAHKRLDCVDCHSAALTTKHPRNSLGSVSFEACSDCHEEQIAAFRGSVHAEVNGDDPSACAGCHGSPHTAVRGGDPAAPMAPVNQVRNCGVCHGEMMQGYLASVHARALFLSGLTDVAPSCSDCHGSHDIRPHDQPDARTSHQNSPRACGECHKGILAQWDESAHGKLWREGRDGPVCATCHHAHSIELPTTVEARQHFPTDCGNCHAELTKTFWDSFHGKATGVGHRSVAMCADCHTPHHNLPASDPRSTVHPDNLAATCGSSNCHSGKINASFLTFDPHSDPMDKDRNPWVHYIYVFMTLLLLGVFGFFAFHDLLWLQRTVIGRLRGEFKTVHGGTGPYVRRFTSAQMWLHVAIIMSFLLLALTGLPLKFSSASWAPGLMTVLGGPEVAGYLHRLAAVVTFGYFAVHLLMLLRDTVFGKERGYFWGWRSMTPQPRDIADLWANLKYFLYLGPRPVFDRWTYWEKFDYLAVFWGVAIIGASGLLLWHPDFFTQFLPGWTLNAAYIVHSEEALLATGFIFLFHFFHTHLRPESFPLDPVIFTGRMPLERFRHERPLEYQRMVDTGTLDDHIVGPPSEALTRLAHVFGFAALALGVWLAVLIFRALLGGAMHLF